MTTSIATDALRRYFAVGAVRRGRARPGVDRAIGRVADGLGASRADAGGDR
ncbi:hypothetical protein [Gordonia sputi]